MIATLRQDHAVGASIKARGSTDCQAARLTYASPWGVGNDRQVRADGGSGEVQGVNVGYCGCGAAAHGHVSHQAVVAAIGGEINGAPGIQDGGAGYNDGACLTDAAAGGQR